LSEHTLEDLFARLERERLAADRLYNDALTAVDRAVQSVPRLPATHAEFDPSLIPTLNDRWNILPDGPAPADRSLKGRLRAFVWRVVAPTLDRQKQFNATLVDHLNRNARGQETLPGTLAALQATLVRELEAIVRFESLLVQFLQTITAYVDTKDRRLGAAELREHVALAEQRIRALTRQVERLGAPASSPAAHGAAEPPAGPVAPSVYVGFEDQFRGTRGAIRDRVAEYVPLFDSASDVLDVGCGRGELLGLLRERGVTARGVDVNEAMVAICRSEGLEAEQDDALAYLRRQADESLGGLVAIQVVEHFPPAYLTQFLEAAFRKMRPGAPLVLETINAACWMAFFECYLRDPTHERPLHPDTLRYLVEAAGFVAAHVNFRQPVPEPDRLEVVSRSAGGNADLEPLAGVVDSHARKLNARLFSSMDYAIVARR
jgi:O-antigen chain-terminating methyltransferase